ncbi:MAG: 5-(carboxyamino)imidazole ribonucleotide synthase [Myxococcota bacterium]
MSEHTPLRRGGVVGMLGGGQLGRMAAMAAARLGYHTHVLCPDEGSPSAQVTHLATIADYEDPAALDAFADAVDVVTMEFENIPVGAVERLTERGVPVYPSALVLGTCQDRALEKQFINDQGVDTAPWRQVESPEELASALEELGRPAILKRARFGYDGKGQVKIDANDARQPAELFAEMGGDRGVLEGFVPFEREVSVIVGRGVAGDVVTYPAVENIHRDHVLWRTIAPATLDADTLDRADTIARTLAEAFDLVGVIAVELFVEPGGVLKVNEMAPRPHNSGHWTIDAAVTSQFEQQIRAVCGLPLGSTSLICPAEMTNLLGHEIHDRDAIAAEPNARIHLYGKTDARPGRKMGHVTRLKL